MDHHGHDLARVEVGRGTMSVDKELLRQSYRALKAMQAACDEWAAEFTQKTRAMNWAVVNKAYCDCEDALRQIKQRLGKT